MFFKKTTMGKQIWPNITNKIFYGAQCCMISIALIASFSDKTCLAKASDCEALTISTCQKLGYDSILLPNRFNHKTQKEVASALDEFTPFIEAGCSQYFRFFLCSLYAPVCDNGEVLQPCRSMCENVTRHCSQLMNEFGIQLQEKIKCDTLPTICDRHQSCLSSRNMSLIAVKNFTTSLGCKQRDSQATAMSYTLSNSYNLPLVQVTLENKPLSNVIITNSSIKNSKINQTRVSLILLRQSNSSYFDIDQSNINLMKFSKTKVSHFTVKRTNIALCRIEKSVLRNFTCSNMMFKSLFLEKSVASHISLKSTNLKSITMFNTKLSYFDLKSSTVNTLSFFNINGSYLEIANVHINILSFVNCEIEYLKIQNSVVELLRQTNTKIMHSSSFDTVKKLIISTKNENSDGHQPTARK